MSTVTSRQGICCPQCSGATRVLTTEYVGGYARRHRSCLDCETVVVTREVPVGETRASGRDEGDGYPCTQCGERTIVLQTRNAAQMVRRRRCCTSCSHSFRTKEYPRS